MRWPHHNCLDTHQSLMPPIQWFHVFTCISGIIFNSPVSTAWIADAAISSHLTYHCGLIIGSTTEKFQIILIVPYKPNEKVVLETKLLPSFDRLQKGTTIGLLMVSLYRPFSFNATKIAFLHAKRFMPVNWP